MLEEEIERISKAIVLELEQAFANSIYPGDDNIVPAYGGLPHCSECEQIMEELKGYEWSAVPLEIVTKERYGLRLLTPQAFRYYLPRYIQVALLFSDETDTLAENIFSALVPPERGTPDLELFTKLVLPFSLAQRVVIAKFINLFTKLEYSYFDPRRDKANEFWQHLSAS